ncbi:CvpA family protein [Blautia sp. HCP28S3_G10]|uniref:CvpA family protein n=1 Tax=Blautia sp. HCP28S3_G10 TaxID=3438908 RepID=UPI003F8BABA7
MTLTWLGAVVAGILLFSGHRGYKKGFIREIVSFFFVFLAIALAWAVNPYVNDFLMEKTPVYQKIQENCKKLSGLQNETESEENTGDEEQKQKSVIEALGLPQILQQSLEANNTEAVYGYLSVNTFTEYITGYLARSIMNGLSFVISYIFATLLIKGATCILDIITGLPVINSANRLTGGAVGIAKGLLFVWLGFLVLTVLCNTEVGKKGLSLIEKDSFLQLLYKYDVFVNFFMNIFNGN